MPIRLRDSTANLGRINSTLADVSGALAGTHTNPAAVSGTVNAMLSPFVGAMVGQFQSNSNRTGTIASTLSGVESQISGTFTASSGSVDAALEADWLARSSGSGVVWFHDFRSADEVNAFRWTLGFSGGNDPNAVGSAQAPLCRRITTDGPTGQCLEIVRQAGSNETSHWWRPFSPIAGSGNGRGEDDPGAGVLLPQTYAPTSGGSQIANWDLNGYYGHSSYHTGSVFDGTEFYLQMRVKMDPRRTDDSNAQIGKLLWLSTTENTNIEQQLVPYSGAYNTPAAHGDPNYFRIFGGGTFDGRSMHDPLEQKDGISGNGNQPGSDLGVCNVNTGANCWAWSGGWDTVMFHLTPGRDSVSESHLEVFAAHEGETSYTKIWDEIWPNTYETGADYANGYNAVILSTYQNGGTFGQEFFHRYAQLIFSHETIPCPQVYAPAAPTYTDLMTVGTWYEISGPAPDLGLSATNHMSSVAPSGPYDGTSGFKSVLNAWNSMVVARTVGDYGSLVPWGGGHRDYYGNGIYPFDLDDRTWGEFRAPSTAGPFSSGAALTDGAYTDGTPSPPHTYYFLQWDIENELMVCLKSITNINAPDIGSASRSIPWRYSFADDEWTRGPDNSASLASPTNGTCCFDSIRNVSWTLDHTIGDFGRYSDAGVDNGDGTFGTWTTFVAPGVYNSGSAMGHDPDTDYIVIMDPTTNACYRKDPDAMTAARTTISMTGTPSMDLGSSLEYSSVLGGFVYHSNGSSGTGNLYLVTTTDDWVTGTFTALTLNTNGKTFTVTDGSISNNIWAKSRTVEFGNRVVQYFVRSYNQPVLAMRLS